LRATIGNRDRRAIFTFHVEGHASIFDCTTTSFQITDDPTAAAGSPLGAVFRHHEAGA